MEIVEERVILNGESFVKTEIEEISSYCTLGSDGITYRLKTGNVSHNGRQVPIALLIRNSPAMQKAMRATLFISPNDVDVIASPDLCPALELYRK